MKKSRTITFIVVGICIFAAVTILVMRLQNSGTADLVNVSPVVQLRDGDDTIVVYLDDKGEQRFTVTGDDGKVKAELLTLKELHAKLPDAADRVAGGLSTIWAGNESGGMSRVRRDEGSFSIKDVGEFHALEGQQSQGPINRLIVEPESSPKIQD